MSPKLIAIPGGTGTIGQSIVSALQSHPEYKPIILSRATSSHPDGTTSSTTIRNSQAPIETRYVNYASTGSLTTALHGINTVISALLIPGPESVPYHLNLLQASITARVHRFAPSEWALPQDTHDQIDLDQGKSVIWTEVQKEVAEGKIDAAAFPVGMFMNYLGIGIRDREVEEQALAGFGEGELMFHLRDEPAWVEVPVMEDGRYPDLTMTDIRDVGRFVVAALGLEEWGGRELGIAGDTRNLREIVDILRRVIGRANVKEVSRAELQRKLDGLDQSEFLKRMDLQYTMLCGNGGSVVKGTLNELCPEVKPTTIRQFMEKYWGD